MREICQVFTGFQHGWVHQWWEVRVVVHLKLGLGGFDGFGLFQFMCLVSGVFV